MTPAIGFVGSLCITLVFLGAAVFTGFKARRKRHLCCVAGAVLMLVSTIYYAIALGELFDLESSGIVTPIHLTTAKINTAAYLFPVITGIWTIKNPSKRKLHGRVAMAVLVLTVFTAVTGTMMLAWATPL
ncbi:MAG: hypothetical protein ACI9F9_001989 [Candidatus Paceibacteria bacterium]|jgi:hypothetical protein